MDWPLNSYGLVYECYLSGQIAEDKWQEYLKNEHFKQFVKKQEKDKRREG